MIKNRKFTVAKDLNESLAKLEPYAKKGRKYATDAVKMIKSTVSEVSDMLQEKIEDLEESNLREDDVFNSLVSQLSKIKAEYAMLPSKLGDEVKSLEKTTFTITVFGRTMAGKSTLMEILTRGDGSTIGKGAQRTTKNVRKYKYKNIQMVDVPGVAAFDGEDDEEIAYNEALHADLIIFVLKDADVQPSLAKSLSKIVSLGKPVICLINVNADIDGDNLSLTSLKLLKRDIEKKMSLEHIGGIKRQLFEFGNAYGQEWNRFRFAYVHLKAAFLAQQGNNSEYASELMTLSRFDYVEKLIADEVFRSGGFYKLKAFMEIVSVPLMNSTETLFEYSAKNRQQSLLMIEKRRELANWLDEFEDTAEDKIEEFLNRISRELEKEISAFSEENYANRRAGEEWNEVVKEKKVQKRAQNVMEELEKECEDELNEIAREIEFDINFSTAENFKTNLDMKDIENGRKIWNWATILVSGGLTIAGLFFTPLLAVGAGVGLFGWLASLFMDDYETQTKKARVELEEKLKDYIDEMIDDLRNSMTDVLYDELIDGNVRVTLQKIDNVVSSLFELSDSQREFGNSLNKRFEEINTALVEEALLFGKCKTIIKELNQLARIPGQAIMLVLEDGTRVSDDVVATINDLLKEKIYFVFDTLDSISILSQALGRKFDRREIRIQEIGGEPRIAHIPNIEKVDAVTKNRIRMAQQLTGLLIVS